LSRLWYKDKQTATLWALRLLMTQAATLPVVAGAGLLYAGSEAGGSPFQPGHCAALSRHLSPASRPYL